MTEARKIIRKAISNQIEEIGYSFVEILSPCPSNWHCSPVQARERVAQTMTQTFPTGIFRDISRRDWVSARRKPTPYCPETAHHAIEAIAKPETLSLPPLLRIGRGLSVCCAGFGGQGILTLGRALAQIALSSGLETAWMPSYGPEMRGGAANCFVRMARDPIASPVVDAPDILIAMNEPAFEKFYAKVKPDGTIFFDADRVSGISLEKTGAALCGIHATQCACDAGDPKSANFVLLGALLGALGVAKEAAAAGLPPALLPRKDAILAGIGAIGADRIRC